jgi:hypothetical protein
MALRHWYGEVRSLFVGERFPATLSAGLAMNIQKAIEERLKRLRELGDRMAASGDASLFDRWGAMEQVLRERGEQRGDDRLRESLQGTISKTIASTGKDYIFAIKSLSAEASRQGTAWLQGIVDAAVAAAIKPLE